MNNYPLPRGRVHVILGEIQARQRPYGRPVRAARGQISLRMSTDIGVHRGYYRSVS